MQINHIQEAPALLGGKPILQAYFPSQSIFGN